MCVASPPLESKIEVSLQYESVLCSTLHCFDLSHWLSSAVHLTKRTPRRSSRAVIFGWRDSCMFLLWQVDFRLQLSSYMLPGAASTAVSRAGVSNSKPVGLFRPAASFYALAYDCLKKQKNMYATLYRTLWKCVSIPEVSVSIWHSIYTQKLTLVCIRYSG